MQLTTFSIRLGAKLDILRSPPMLCTSLVCTYYNHTHVIHTMHTTDEILTIADIHRIHEALFPAHTHWFDIGLTLEVDHQTLCGIRKEFSSFRDCLREMLSCRLMGGGNLTWRILCTCLRNSIVGRNDLANDIEKDLESEFK